MTIIKKYNDGTSQWEAIAVGQKGESGGSGSSAEIVPEGGTTGQSLVKASNTDYELAWSSDFASAAQGSLADTAVQPNDNVSELTNDANYITAAGAPVQSVNTQTGAVTLAASDVGAYPDTNPSSYITAAQAPVQSVNGDTGVVVLDKTDVGLGDVDNVSASDLRDRSTHTGTQTLSTISNAGSIASQDANNVNITGGSIAGITDLEIADGGTGASSASAARTNLGLGDVDNVSAADLRDRSTHTGTQTLSTISDAGTMASQDANSVAITGGSVDATLAYDNTTSGLSATDVQAAIDEVSGSSSADADNVIYDNTASGLSATDVQAAIDEVATSGGGASSANNVTYDNTTSGLSATDVQAAIDEVNTVVTSTSAAAKVDNATGDYGTVKVDDDRGVSFAGYAIRDDWVFMSDGSSDAGIYNDTDNEWSIRFNRNSTTDLMHNGSEKLRTESYGVLVSGEVRATDNVTAYFSDERLKDFDGTIPNALDKVTQINGYYFHENAKAKELGYNNSGRQVGVSAQQVQQVLPEVVDLAAVTYHENSQEQYLAVHYDKLVPVLIEAIKEQQQQIDELREAVHGAS